MEAHNAAIEQISARLQDFYSRKEKFRIFHGSTNSTRIYSVDRKKMIDTSSLSHVISVDVKNCTALVEPNVPMDSLVKATLAYGLVPPVVMEFPGITVGGGFSGTGGESSSFKYGSFDRIVNWVEVVLPDGEVVKASKSEHPDLFAGATGSLGTLGVATLFELQLIEAKLYVEVTYTPKSTAKATLETIQNASSDAKNDYVDGILMSKDKGIVVTGKLTDSLDTTLRVQTFTGASDPWFYTHADRVTKRPETSFKELVPLVDYLFRYDRGAFWMGKYAYKYFMVPFNRITRWALDDFMKTRTMYHALHASGHSQRYIIQDLALPGSKAEEFINRIDENFGFYPLWLCPLKPMKSTSLHPHAIYDSDATANQQLLINVGVWGPGAADLPGSVEVNRKLESILHSLGGRKWLYAPAFYSEDEFWNIYDKKWYDELRRRYKASHLPSAYDKARVDLSKSESSNAMQDRLLESFWSVWPMSGLYGVARTLVSKEYLLAK